MMNSRALIISIFSITLAVALNARSCAGDKVPLIVVTWAFNNAAEKGWDVLQNEKRSALDAVEAACTTCEDQQCYKTVGYGGNPDESGETTLDAMIMDGVTMDVGAVAGLRNIKNANSVARRVLENTQHSLLAGSLATDFAEKMGFKRESLQTDESKDLWLKWKNNNCQPNFWKNVVPDSQSGCGPYQANRTTHGNSATVPKIDENNHDTIGVIAIDINGNIASGTSTNGLMHKIPGRVGDTPIPGAGSYADHEVGAAAATGQGDIMMRFLPSFLAVEEMRRGLSPTDAAKSAIERIRLRYPSFGGAIIALNKHGHYGVACYGPNRFPYYVANPELGNATAMFADCSYHSDDASSKGISVSGFTTPKPDHL